MALVEKEYWVEVRPLVTAELATSNFAPIIDALHSLAEPFRFLVIDTCIGSVCERRLVRFYFQFKDEQTRKQMSNVIRALLDVEVVSADPPVQQYRFKTDLELAKNYALPIITVDNQAKTQVNLIDRIVASLAGTDACVEVTAIADPHAILGVQKYLYNKVSRKSGLGKAFFDPVVDLIGEAAGRGSNEPNRGKMVQPKIDPWVRECLKQGEMKLASKLFTCKIIIKSSTSQGVQGVKNALPAAMNHFKPFKTDKKQTQPPTSTLKKPSRYTLKNNLLCNLWWSMPIMVLLFASFLGLFNPLKITPSILGLDVGLLGLAACLAVSLLVAFRKRQPIVLSTPELAQIIGLPTAVAKLPVALGKVPIARMQLAHQQTETQ
ncbi:MAG: hypothetical protein FWC33_06200 [Candidatus Bathyarchaeota archaeon]|nr:hypothetical protein [Candidatus Termiticorpusculum sp.]